MGWVRSAAASHADSGRQHRSGELSQGVVLFIRRDSWVGARLPESLDLCRVHEHPLVPSDAIPLDASFGKPALQRPPRYPSPTGCLVQGYDLRHFRNSGADLRLQPPNSAKLAYTKDADGERFLPNRIRRRSSRRRWYGLGPCPAGSAVLPAVWVA